MNLAKKCVFIDKNYLRRAFLMFILNSRVLETTSEMFLFIQKASCIKSSNVKSREVNREAWTQFEC